MTYDLPFSDDETAHARDTPADVAGPPLLMVGASHERYVHRRFSHITVRPAVRPDTSPISSADQLRDEIVLVSALVRLRAAQVSLWAREHAQSLRLAAVVIGIVAAIAAGNVWLQARTLPIEMR